MKYRMIGTDPKTQRQVSVLSLGAMLFGTVTDEATSRRRRGCPATRSSSTTTRTCGSAPTCRPCGPRTATWA
jgi:hypothetical protein